MNQYPPKEPIFSPDRHGYVEGNEFQRYASPNDTFGIDHNISTPFGNNGNNMPPSSSQMGRRLNNPNLTSIPPQYVLDASPITRDYLTTPIANVAVEYGSKLMGTGREMVDKEINRYIQVPILKQYFAVNTSYVKKKLLLVLFPFFCSDWSVKYTESGVRAEPRTHINSPDLYIPFMAFMTYVFTAGVLLGINDLFDPEKLGIISSQAMAWTIVEILIQLVFLYFINVETTSITTCDILAYSGYKFIGINMILLSGLFPNNLVYWLSLLYSCLTMAYFTVKTLKWRLMADVQTDYRAQHSALDYKRKQYFLVTLALSHVFQMWWLSGSLLKKLH